MSAHGVDGPDSTESLGEDELEPVVTDPVLEEELRKEWTEPKPGRAWDRARAQIKSAWRAAFHKFS